MSWMRGDQGPRSKIRAEVGSCRSMLLVRKRKGYRRLNKVTFAVGASSSSLVWLLLSRGGGIGNASCMPSLSGSPWGAESFMVKLGGPQSLGLHPYSKSDTGQVLQLHFPVM